MKSSEIIIFFPSIEKGGADKNLFTISNYLATKLPNVSVLTSSNKYKSRFKKIKYIGPNSDIFENLGRGLKTIIATYYLIKFIFTQKKFLVISFQSNIFAILICKLFSIKIITRSNSFPNDWTNNFIKKLIFKIIYKLADKTIVNSKSIKSKFVKFYGLNPVHIYNPIDKLKIISLSKNKIKKIYKSKNSLKLIMVGRLSKEKDHKTFLKSLKILSKKLFFEAIILGSGHQEKKIKNVILDYDLQNKVKILSFKDNPYPYIKQSDILILSSLHEGLPNVLIEAAVLKTFVISSNCETGPKEILLNGKAGGLFKVSDSKNLADLILFFQKNKKIRNSMVLKAYKNINRFDFIKNLNKYLQIINKINN